MTYVGVAPAGARSVDLVTDAHRADLDRLIDADPIVNAVVASRVAASGSLDPARFGGVVLGVRTSRNDALVGAACTGGNLLPLGGDPPCWYRLAHRIASAPRECASIVGRADAVSAMWQVFEPVWGPARAVRDDQPLLVVGRGEPGRICADPRVRVMRPDDIERYLPAAAAMFTEELGISPFARCSGPSYRRRVEYLLAGGRAFGVVDRDGRMAFKADIGALTAYTCQLQGVWVRPDLRERGLGTTALAAVLHRALRLAPTASLYVNAFNTAARRMYARLGMRQVSTLATVLF